jgi:nucleoid-associated protein YgaU
MMQIKKITPWITLAGAAMIGGCANTPPKSADAGAMNGNVTDIRPMESTPPTYQPAPVEPVAYTPPPAAAPIESTTPTSAAGNTHVVKRGETLYGIAKQTYGSGKEWQKIAMANPGVTPTSLRVGQTLIIP